ncbi:MAG: dihydrodipicolinate synthase family protein [Treponema sp.]|jgi:4-hydroxy-tetrahydrodipicolinate synthase|nr:dihydrodipicolinate synthase family protein [Treponema sp.]
MKKEFYGCWPTMITPFTDNDRIDFKAVRDLTEWYIAKGCDGIFAVCQSSEMFFLREQEKIDLARAVMDAAAGRVKVIASGHTSEDKSKQVEELGRMAETGVDAVVLVCNRLAKQDEDETVFLNNFDDILRQLPGVVFGMYECPYPCHRLVTLPFLKDCAEKGRLVFLKDTCSSLELIKERIVAASGTGLSLFNANTATLLDTLAAGADGYNGVMANFHIDIYKWLYLRFKDEPELAGEVSDFLTLAAVIEARAYPMSAKYHFNITGVPMDIHTRSKNKELLNGNARREVESLVRLEDSLRRRLGL